MGRPTKLNQQLIDKTQEYIKHCIETNEIPYVERLAIQLDISVDSISRWSDKGKDNQDNSKEDIDNELISSDLLIKFSGVIKRVKELQRLALQEKLIKSNSIGAMFLLKAKHGYMETSKQINEGSPTTIVVADIGYNPTKPVKPVTKPLTASSKPS